MSICAFCGKDKLGAKSCLESRIVIDGVSYRPVPHKRAEDPFSRESDRRCTDCNVIPGGFHHVGCSVEICPQCGGHWIFCRCLGKKEQMDKKEEQGATVIPFK